jgi:hypothetical protein
MRLVPWWPWSSAIFVTELSGATALSGVVASPGLAIGPIALQRSLQPGQRAI